MGNETPMATGAVLSSCGHYRYLLERHWDHSKHALGFVMLNPSTADAMEDDPTIRRCIRFAKDNGFGAIYVGNLFAWRATDPADLPTDRQLAIGPDRDFFLHRMGMQCRTVVAAWGSKLPRFADKPFLYVSLCEALDDIGVRRAKCLGTTKNGQPRHPLYVRADQPLVDFRM